jgi:two-component system, OmpR family, response regulator MtrA
MTTDQDNPPIVAAVTRNVLTRADLARQLPGDSVLLFFPDEATAVRTLAEAMPGAVPDRDEVPAPAVSLGDLVIDSLRMQVTWNGIPLKLTRLERQLLSCLATPPIRAWPYELLYRSVWRDTWLGDTSALHATVKRLRRKLRSAGATVALESVRGVGFRLETEPAQLLWPAPAARHDTADARAVEASGPGEAG